MSFSQIALTFDLFGIIQGWTVSEYPLLGQQMWPVSLTKLSPVEVHRSKWVRSPWYLSSISIQSAGELCRTCFVTESMSRMYRSCSWRTPATITRACALRTQPSRESPLSARRYQVNSRRAVVTARDLIAWLKTIELFSRSLARQNYIGLSL